MASPAIEPPEGFVLEDQPAPAGGTTPPLPEGFQIQKQPEPSLSGGNAALARTIGNAMKPALDTVTDMGSLYAPLETGLNAATGLLFGFPAYVGAGLGGLAQKYLLGMDVDPKELAETVSKIFTFIPPSERGKRLTGNVMLPLEKLAEAGQAAGHAIIDTSTAKGRGGVVRAPGTPEAAVAAVTDATIQMLPGVLLGAFGRRMSGQIPSSEDFTNTAKTIVPDSATVEHVAAAESNLRETYAKTGIDPFTVADAAKTDANVATDLIKPDAGVPKPFSDFLEKAEPDAPSVDDIHTLADERGIPWDNDPDFLALTKELTGKEHLDELTPNERQAVYDEVSGQDEPALDLSGPTNSELRHMAGEAGWAQVGGRLLRDGEGASADEIAAGRGAEVGNVTGRSEWIPKAEWFQRMRQELKGKELSSQTDIQDAVNKHLDGKELTTKEQRTVDWMNEEAKIAIADREPPDTWKTMTDEEKENELDKLFGADSRAGAKPADASTGEKATAAEVGQGESQVRNAEAISSIRQRITAEKAAAEKALSEGKQQVKELDPTQQPPDSAYKLVEMNLGLNPSAMVKAIGESYTPFVGVEQEPRPRGPVGDALQKIFAPASRGPIAETQAGIMRANLGAMAREREVAMTKMEDYAKQFDKDTPENNYKFIDAMEKGTALDNPKMAESAKALRELLDTKRDEVQALGKGQLENFDENYFPHIWKDPEAISAFFSRRPLTGSGSFLKQRSFETFKEGLDAGFKPITDNPVELALLKAREIDRYVYGQKIFEEMKDAGLAKFVRFGDEAPQGWTKINDKVARVFQHSEPEAGMILRGEYYAPDEAATLINNHLSPGLQGNGFYDAWRGVGMALNSLQLGLSAFHVGFTTLDSMVSRVSLGIKQMARGDVIEGAGNIGVGLSPAQPFLNIYKGDRLLRAYLGKLDDPDLAPIVGAIMDAGGRVKMDDFYRNATVNGFKQALRAGDTVGAAKALLPTILDRMNVPIFEWLVPRQKLGVYFDMAQDFLKNNPDADVATKRAELGKLWDSVDNRMGQLVYDNVFWNRVLKDSLMATVRSVGWNLGTFREIGGGVYDIKDILKNKGISDRTGYIIALPLLAGVYGAITQYAYTGELPRDMKDLYFPRTGRIRPDGTEDRVSLPTYMKDVYAYAKDAMDFGKYGSNPTQTIQNKAHPLISTISQMLNNQDFFGAAIRNPADSIVKQAMDEADYLVKQFEPFSLRNYEQQAKIRGEEPSVKDYLTSPSMVGITPAPGYITKSPEEQESAEISRLRDPIMKKYRQLIKDNPDKAGEYVGEMQKAGLTKNDIRFVLRSSGNTQRRGRLRQFGTEEATQ